MKLEDNEKLALIIHVATSQGWGDNKERIKRIKEICDES